jgi:hypothetical protein
MAGAGGLDKPPANVASLRAARRSRWISQEVVETVEVRGLAKVNLLVARKTAVVVRPVRDVPNQPEAVTATVVARPSEDRQAPVVQEGTAARMVKVAAKTVALATTAKDVDVGRWRLFPSRGMEEGTAVMDLAVEKVGSCTTEAAIRGAAKVVAVATTHMATAAKVVGIPAAAKFPQLRTAMAETNPVVARRAQGAAVATLANVGAREVMAVAARVVDAKVTKGVPKRADSARARPHASKILPTTRWLTVSVVWALVADDS